MAAPMLSVLCKEFVKVPRCLERMSSVALLRNNSLLFDGRGSNRYNSYCQSTGNEPDKLYKTLEIEVKGHDPAVIKSYEQFVCMAARELDVNVSKVWSPPKVIRRWTLLKSVHIYAKHKVQYETRTLFRTIEMKHVTGSTADTLLEYIERNLPEGMAMKVTRHAIEAVPEHLTPPVFPSETSVDAASTEKQPLSK